MQKKLNLNLKLHPRKWIVAKIFRGLYLDQLTLLGPCKTPTLEMYPTGIQEIFSFSIWDFCISIIFENCTNIISIMGNYFMGNLFTQ